MSQQMLEQLKALTIGDLVQAVSSHPEILDQARLKGQGVLKDVDEPVMVVVGVGKAANMLAKVFLNMAEYLQDTRETIVIDRSALTPDEIRNQPEEGN